MQMCFSCFSILVHRYGGYFECPYCTKRYGVYCQPPEDNVRPPIPSFVDQLIPTAGVQYVPRDDDFDPDEFKEDYNPQRSTVGERAARRSEMRDREAELSRMSAMQGPDQRDNIDTDFTMIAPQTVPDMNSTLVATNSNNETALNREITFPLSTPVIADESMSNSILLQIANGTFNYPAGIREPFHPLFPPVAMEILLNIFKQNDVCVDGLKLGLIGGIKLSSVNNCGAHITELNDANASFLSSFFEIPSHINWLVGYIPRDIIIKYFKKCLDLEIGFCLFMPLAVLSVCKDIVKNRNKPIIVKIISQQLLRSYRIYIPPMCWYLGNVPGCDDSLLQVSFY